MILFALFCILASTSIVCASDRFQDDDETGSWSWASTPIYWAKMQHITYGCGNNQFQPDRILTRAQAYTMMVRLYEQVRAVCPVGEHAPVFEDCKQSWYTEPLQKAIAFGLLDFSPGKRFYPNEHMTRGEATAALFQFPELRAIIETHEKQHRTTGDHSRWSSRFPDVASGNANALEIYYADLLYIANGYRDGWFRPDREITRAEFVKMLYRFDQFLLRDKFSFNNLDSVFSQAAKVTIDRGGPYPMYYDCPMRELTDIEIQQVVSSLHSAQRTDEWYDNEAIIWIRAWDEDGCPIVSIGIDADIGYSMAYLFVYQDCFCTRYIINSTENEVPFWEKTPSWLMDIE